MSERNLKLPLFLARLSIFGFLLPWQIARFTGPDLINTVATTHYKVPVSSTLSTISGVLMIVLLLAFLVGFKKKISYGLVFLIHAAGTIMTIPSLIKGAKFLITSDLSNGFQPTALFLAAVPAAFAMLLLYCLRDEDTMFSLNK